jgi:cell division protein FtsL
MSVKPVSLFLLMLAVIGSSIGVVYARHEGRKQFVKLQTLVSDKERMDVEWGQLQLEQSTLTTQGQIEHAARKRLGMINPLPGQIVILEP